MLMEMHKMVTIKKGILGVIIIIVAIFASAFLYLFNIYNSCEAGWYVIDSEGNIINQKPFDICYSFCSNRLLYITQSEDEQGKCMLVRNDGSIFLDEVFNEGEVYNQLFSLFPQDYYFVDRGEYIEIYDYDGNITGQVSSLSRWDYFQPNGLACVKDSKTEKYGCIDKTGKYVIEPKYEDYIDFNKIGLGATEDSDGNKVVLDQNGNVVFVLTGISYFGADLNSEYFVAMDADTDKCGYVDEKGNFIIAPQFDDCHFFSDGMGMVEAGGRKKIGYVNTDGVLIRVANMSDGRDYKNGYAAVENSLGLWGFIDKEGHYTIGPKYLEAGDFFCGMAPVKRQDNTWTFVDENGLEKNYSFQNASPFSENGIAAILVDGLWGYMYTDGTWFIKPQFKSVREFEGNIASVYMSKWQRFILKIKGDDLQ